MAKDAVPTIFFKQTSLGLEMVQVPYDAENNQYFGQESIELLRGNISVEDEEAITIRKQERLDELRSFCRFCFCQNPKNDSKCLHVSKLETYNIDINELLVSIGLPPANDFCGELICEQCFQQIVDIDLFKKKCREAHDEVFTEIFELDSKIHEVRSSKDSDKVWHKNDIGLGMEQELQLEQSTIEVLEEHLVDEAEFDDVNYQFESQEPNQLDGSEEFIEEVHDGYKIIYQQLPEVNACEDSMLKEIVDSEIMHEEALEGCQPMDIEVMEIVNLKTEDNSGQDEILHGVDEYEAVSTDDIIKNPERNRFCFRIYECFFCKNVS